MHQLSREAHQGLWKKVHKTPELIHTDPVVMIDIQHVDHVLAVLNAD